MALIKVEGVTHWSIPVNDLEESEIFYSDVLGLENRGRVGKHASCFTVGGHSFLLCQRNDPIVRTPKQDNRLHYAFDISSETFERVCKLFQEKGLQIAEPIAYREGGFFPGRELYIFDPSGNMIELKDTTWEPGMPKPSFEEIVGS